MLDGKILREMQEAVGVSDEEIAARAKISKSTLRRAMQNLVPEDTREKIGASIESLHVERNEQYQRLKKLKARTG